MLNDARLGVLATAKIRPKQLVADAHDARGVQWPDV